MAACILSPTELALHGDEDLHELDDSGGSSSPRFSRLLLREERFQDLDLALGLVAISARPSSTSSSSPLARA
jgi:hypothetical protein